MSVIETFYQSTFTATRYTTSTATGSDVSSVASSGSCLVRPVSDKAKLLIESNLGKEYDLLCDEDKDINVGDNIAVSGQLAGSYKVQGVSKYEDLEDDTESHLDIRIMIR